MATMFNCVMATCDRCGYSSYYPSSRYAENVGWGFSAEIWNEKKPLDLCPKCNEQWAELVHKFIYEATEE